MGRSVAAGGAGRSAHGPCAPSEGGTTAWIGARCPPAAGAVSDRSITTEGLSSLPYGPVLVDGFASACIRCSPFTGTADRSAPAIWPGLPTRDTPPPAPAPQPDGGAPSHRG